MTTRTTTSNGGTAQYVFDNEMPPEFLIEAIPGARAAHTEWLAENAEGKNKRVEFSRSGRALLAYRQTRPLAADLESAERAHDSARKALEAQSKKSLAALRRFDALVNGHGLDPIEFKTIAATHAAARQADAVAAWRDLCDALASRDESYRIAGSPGRSWTTRSNAPQNHFGAVRSAEELFDIRVNGFDLTAVQQTAEGTYESTDPGAAEAAIDTHNSTTAAATRRRK